MFVGGLRAASERVCAWSLRSLGSDTQSLFSWQNDSDVEAGLIELAKLANPMINKAHQVASDNACVYSKEAHIDTHVKAAARRRSWPYGTHLLHPSTSQCSQTQKIQS